MTGNQRDTGDEFVIEQVITPEDIDRYKYELIFAAVNYIHGEESDFFATAEVGETVHFERTKKTGGSSLSRIIVDAYVEEFEPEDEIEPQTTLQQSGKQRLLRYGRVIIEQSQAAEMTEKVIESLQPPDEIGREEFLGQIKPDEDGDRPVRAWEIREYKVVSDRPGIEVSNYFELQFEDGEVYASDEDLSAETEDGECLSDAEADALNEAQRSFDNVFTVDDYMIVRNGLLDAAIYV